MIGKLSQVVVVAGFLSAVALGQQYEFRRSPEVARRRPPYRR